MTRVLPICLASLSLDHVCARIDLFKKVSSLKKLQCHLQILTRQKSLKIKCFLFVLGEPLKVMCYLYPWVCLDVVMETWDNVRIDGMCIRLLLALYLSVHHSLTTPQQIHICDSLFNSCTEFYCIVSVFSPSEMIMCAVVVGT